MIRPMLTAWLDEACAREWDWAGWNCILAPADWALRLTGADPAAAWRADCRDEASARAVVRRAGGLVRLAGAALEPLGWRRVTGSPGVGAVGVVRRAGPDGDRPGRIGLRTGFGAVCLGARWALATGDGLLVEPARPIAAWEYAHG